MNSELDKLWFWLPHVYKRKKPQDNVLRPISLFFCSFSDYLTESAATESAATESACTLSTIESAAIESAVESAFWAGLELPPQDAKEIAAIATNIKTNFFIFFAF